LLGGFFIPHDHRQHRNTHFCIVVLNEKTAQQILVYTLLLLPITLLLVYPLGVSGGVYAIFAIALGYVFLKKAWLLNQTPADKDLSKSLFKYSILYMMLLSAGMVVDQLPWMQQLNFTLGEQLNILLTAIPMISVILG
ncbi:MAG: protoheme IX farnesyltransferase, partial [Cyanobacteria bacterium J06642_9]